ncbi:MAG: glycosyltransferase [Planctomycetota bacterium]|nr:glycosyltransferase [Planctomycetota bacterium]MEC7719330.1 glycosyltransferase [Planctomycetota bacterium]MEC8781379.1 glycosyltransferase [Planctomycetota bacterium]
MLKTETHLPLLARKAFPSFRVAIISDALAGRNGVGTYYQDLAQHLRNVGVGVEFICPTSERDRSFESFRIPLPGDATQAMVYPKRNRLRERLDRFRPHIVLIPTLGPYSFIGAQEAHRRKIPICMGHHTDFEKLTKLYWHPFFASTGSRMLRSIHRMLLSYATAIVAISEDSVRDARQLRGRRVYLVGTPLANEFLENSDQTTVAGISRVLFVGRLAREKNVDTLLDAAKQLPRVQFQIVGDGPLRPHLQAAANRVDNVHLTGWLSRSEVLDEVDRCDLLVLPSSIETFGTVALEGVARYRPVLVSQHCGIHDWPDLAQGLFSQGAHETVAQAITRIAKLSVKEKKAVVQRGWQAAHEWNDTTINGWMQILYGLVDSSLQLPKALNVN